jgi:hypothetical protein
MATPGFVTLVYWNCPLGEGQPRCLARHAAARVNHPLAKFRFLVNCPAEIADEVVRSTKSGCHRLDDEEAGR